MKKILNKLIASIATMAILSGYISILGNCAIVYAAENLNSQTSSTNNQNVEFDAYLKESENITHTAIKTINAENSIYFKMQVKDNGYIKNAKVEITNANYAIGNVTNTNVQSATDSTIVFNQISAGKSNEIEIPITFKNADQINPTEFNKESQINFTAQYMDKDGNTKQITKTVKLQVEWKREAHLQVAQKMDKYIPYNINGEKGIILQTLVTSNIMDNVLPMKESKIEVTVPTINNIKPTQVTVNANSTAAINGEENAQSFTQANYIYDAENNKITINAQNTANKNGEISWKKAAQDEYVVTYRFSKAALENIEKGLSVTLKAEATAKAYENTELTLTANSTNTESVTDKLSQIVTTETSLNEKILKSYMMSNTEETEFTKTSSINIAYAELVDEIELKLQSEIFKTEDGSTTAMTQNPYFKQITINKNKFIDIFGEEGTLTIQSTEGTTVATINATSQIDENGNVVVGLTNLNIGELVIKTTKPQKNGKIEITATKAIKPTNLSAQQIQNITTLQTTNTIQAKNATTVIAQQEQNAQTTFENPQMNVQLNADKQTIVAGADNNIEFTATLYTSQVTDMLYTNPTIQIELPSYIESANISSVEVVFNSELKIKDYTVQDVNGKKMLVIQLTGTQTKYDIGLVSGGANIKINTTLKVKNLIPTQETTIKMNVINNSKYTVIANTVEATMNQKVESPAGIVTINKMSNYNSNGETVQSVNGEENLGTLDLQSAETKTATIQNIVMNNNGGTANNVSILGRTIYKGNKNILTSEELGTTFDAPMASTLNVEGINSNIVHIYYSENADATKDLTNTQNGWTQTSTDLSKVKSYLVIIDKIEIGDIATLSYTATIPAGLGRNNTGYAQYAVYYTSANATSEDRVFAPLTGITTGQGPEISVGINSNASTNDVQEGQIITYTVTVKNIGKVTAKGIIIGADIPENTTYVQYTAGTTGNNDTYVENKTKTKATKAITSLEPNQTATLEFDVKVNETTAGKEIKLKAFGTANEITNLVYSSEVTNKIIKGYIDASMVTKPGISSTLKGGSILQYVTTIKNLQEEEQKNVIVTDVLPKGVNYKEAYYVTDSEKITKNIQYNENTRTITINIDTLSIDMSTQVYVIVEIDKTAYDITAISNYMNIQHKDENNTAKTVTTNKITNNVTVEKASLETSLTSNVPEGNIEVGESILYILEIKNTGTKLLENIQISSVLPEGLKYISSKYELDGVESVLGGGTTNEKGEPVELTANIMVGKTLKYTITALVQEIEGTSKNIEYNVKVSQTEVGETTNTIKHTIVAKSENGNENGNDNDNSNDNNNGNNGNTENNGQTGGDLTGNRKIQGTVWIDTNKNGQKDSDEQKVSGVQVMLYNYSTGNLVSDGKGKPVIITTTSNGQYQFSKIPEGNYSVIFKYDSAKYSATEYKKVGVDPIVNSDAIDTKMKIDGEELTAGLTERITITNANMYNIDLGIIEDSKFDLSLSKTITAVTVQNPTGTATYDYDHETLAKRELIGKYVSQTTIVVEYTITVKNEGAIAGYAKKIVDYLPSNLKFNAELNRDWYQGQNGEIYSSSLSNTKIEAGEEKEVKLYLTKALTDSDLGVTNNTAEIYETYNEAGLTDFDSTPANKTANEDDIGQADLILSIRTGAATIILVIITTIGIIVAIAFVAYHARKAIFRRM